jgi:hypothetical protein
VGDQSPHSQRDQSRKRKRPHIDQYEEGIAQEAIDESQHRNIGGPQVLYQELAPARSIGYRGVTGPARYGLVRV